MEEDEEMTADEAAVFMGALPPYSDGDDLPPGKVSKEVQGGCREGCCSQEGQGVGGCTSQDRDMCLAQFGLGHASAILIVFGRSYNHSVNVSQLDTGDSDHDCTI